MKKFYLALFFTFFALIQISLASWVSNQPYQIVQPDGFVIECLLSGDEFYNWLHDEAGYTIIQDEDGFYYYAIKEKDKIKPSVYKAGAVNPASVGLSTNIRISKDEYNRRKSFMELKNERSSRAPHQGTLNNLVVYIKFADDTEFTSTRQFYDDKFNPVTGNTLKSYYSEVSYNQLTISSSHYPESAMNTNFSYTDTHNRSYFEPYNATTNPNGYNGETQRRLREHALLRDAINWVNANSPVPGTLNIDGDNDGRVDNVCFIIRGGNGAWASLLWAHRWALYTYNVTINGKQVYDYTFQPETQVEVKTLCHEMFHALGAPDLYHYNDGGLDIAPVGKWDLMESGGGHMGAYMKWKYSNQVWINAIPEITVGGTYTLNPLTSSTNNCYKIASPNSTNEFFVVEYRKSSGTFESTLPGSGLIVYRIDPAYNGNADGPPDEVYVYRPNGTPTTNGSINSAYYSSTSGRTAINSGTNPSPFLQDGSPGGLDIYNVTAAGATISFTVGMSTVANPTNLAAQGINETQIDLSWNLNASGNDILLVYNETPVTDMPVNGSGYIPGTVLPGGGQVLFSGATNTFSHSDLLASTRYYYKLWSVNATHEYSSGIAVNALTQCGNIQLPYQAGFNNMEFPACWTQQQEGNGTAESWQASPTSYAGGSANEMKSTWQDVSSGISRLILPPFNSVGMAEVSLNFKHLFDDYSAGVTLSIQTSTDGVNWSNESWSLASGGPGIVGPEPVNISVQQNLNAEQTYIAFVVEGNLYNYDNWYIDDVGVDVTAWMSFTVNATSLPIEGGTASGSGDYLYGETVTLVAQAAPGYSFGYWSENGIQISTSPTFSFQAEADRELIAHYNIQQFVINTISNPIEGGATTGGGLYDYGTQATVNALPAQGYNFINWTEDAITVNNNPEYSFNVTGNASLVANFELQQLTVQTESNPGEGGTTLGAGTYDFGSLVQVEAIPEDGYTFVNWTRAGEIIATTSLYSFVIETDQHLIAHFNLTLPEYTLQLSASPSAGGSVTGSGTFAAGSQQTVTAMANTGWIFKHWTENGQVVSSNAAYTFTLNSNRTLIAIFLQQFNILATASPAEYGYTEGQGIYPEGDSIVLNAYANSGFIFEKWTENDIEISNSPQMNLVVTGTHEFVAHFKMPVGVAQLKKGEVSVFPNPAYDYITLICKHKVEHAALISITGAVIWQQQNIDSSNGTRINLSTCPAGLYFLRLTFGHSPQQVIKLTVLK
jgi:M6 family metalloprotease-like protein